MTKKRCATCNQRKTRSEFYKDKRAADGLYSHCKLCHCGMTMGWAAKHPIKKRAIDDAADLRGSNDVRRKTRRKLRLDVIAGYGNRCVCCGESREQFLTIEHRYSGGKKHRATLGTGYAFYRWLKLNDFPPEFECLCWNCNCSKGRYGYCPHERERAEKIGGMTFDKVYVDEFETKQRECLLSDKVFKIAS